MDSQFSSCTSIDLKKINFVFCTTAATGCLVSAIILLLIFTHKAFYSVLQRLFLYLMIAIFLRELFMAASFEHHFRYDPNVQDNVCSGIGFMKNWTGILVFMFTVGMKVCLLVYARRTAQGKTGPIILNSKQGRIILETSFVVLTIIVTLLYSSVPFYTNNYGLAGPWCWIRVLDANCTVSKSGVVHQMLNGYIFYVSGSVIGFILLIVTVVLYCRLPMTHSNEKAARMLLKKTFCVIITFLVNIVMMVFALLARVFTVQEQQYKLSGVWYSFGVMFPISLLLFPTVYMICFFRLNMCGLCSRYNDHHHHTGHKPDTGHSVMEQTTVQSSSRISAPSTTFYESPYTDGFTDSQMTERERLLMLNDSTAAAEETTRRYGSFN